MPLMNKNEAFAKTRLRDFELKMSCSSQELTGSGLEALLLSQADIDDANKAYRHVQRQRADLWTAFFNAYPDFTQ